MVRTPDYSFIGIILVKCLDSLYEFYQSHKLGFFYLFVAILLDLDIKRNKKK